MKIEVVIPITIMAGIIITLVMNCSGNLQEREAIIIIAEPIIKANPIVVKKLAESFLKSINKDEIENGIRITPTATVTAI